ncbi:MAG: moeZ 2 [Marmoricola sp.]|nr:moeZ 2 [Marmoricola sp.]
MNGIPAVTIDLLPDPLPADLVVLDVREPVEWAHGRIDGAIHIPLGQLVERVGELPEGQTLVVCKVGGRSAQATGYLVANGRDAINLDGGMLEWAAGGRPMVSDAGEPMVV